LSALRLRLSPSPLLAALIVVVHAAAGLSAWAVIPGLAGALLGAALIALGTAAAWSRALLKSASSVHALELGPSRMAVQLAGGERFETAIAGRRFVSKLLVALPVPGSRTILITRDMLGADSFRALRIWALWGRLPGAAGSRPVAAEQLVS
jgi:hypothetical protein